MLAKHSSGWVNRVAGLYNILSGELSSVAPREKGNITNESSAAAPKSDFANLKSFPVVVPMVTANPKTELRPSVMGFILEGFALHAASLYPANFGPVQSHPHEEKILRSRESSAQGRCGSTSPFSTTISCSPGFGLESDSRKISPTGSEVVGSEVPLTQDNLAEFGDVIAVRNGRSFSWLAPCWEAVVTLWTYGRKRRKIKRAAAVLAELDDRTLRDMGILDRSQIKRAVRYGRDY
jgi:hypothetical protein